MGKREGGGRKGERKESILQLAKCSFTYIILLKSWGSKETCREGSTHHTIRL